MKTIGLLTAWACEDWIQPVIQNALRYVDILNVAVAYHHPDMKDLEDRTYRKVCEMEKINTKVQIWDGYNNDNSSIPPDHAKCRILNTMMEAHVGDVIMICDADEFYDDAGIADIKQFAKSDHDMGVVQSMYFCVDGKHFVINREMPRLFRVCEGFHFVPTQRPVPNPRKPVTLKSLMYHYTFLLNPELKRRYWRHSPIGNPAKCQRKIDWLNNVYMTWDVNRKAKFWMQDDFEEAAGGGLIPFDGEHPVEIASFVNSIPDFRKHYEGK